MDRARTKISPRMQAILDAVGAAAKESERSMSQVAINWARQQQGVIPIIAGRTAAQLADNMAAAEWRLSDEQIAKLDEVSKIDLGFPHDFLEGNSLIFGATFDLIDKRN
jgi:aryl-alcohol dehydrogenase-like predicted oxidoreductase